MICYKCRKSTNKEYINLHHCFVCSLFFCANYCSSDHHHNIIYDVNVLYLQYRPLIIFQNNYVDDIVQNKIDSFDQNTMIVVDILYHTRDTWFETSIKHSERNEINSLKRECKFDHRRFQIQLHEMKQKFLYEVMKYYLEKIFCSDISNLILEFV